MKSNSKLVMILDNIRSLYNVGSIFRTADGAGVSKIYLTGITGYPKTVDDPRKPWEIETVSNRITKTALGADQTVDWAYEPDPKTVVTKLRQKGYTIWGLEKNDKSHDIFKEVMDSAIVTKDIALIVGNEIDGVQNELMEEADQILHLPMKGEKKSLNVATATAIAVYTLIFGARWAGKNKP